MPRLTSGLFRITLRRILLLRLAGILVLLIAIGTLCAMALMHADIQSVVSDTLAPISDVGRIQSDFNNDYQVLSHAVLMRLPSAVDDAATAIKSNRVDIDRYWKPLVQSGLGTQEKQLLTMAADHRKDAEQVMDDTLALLQAGQFDVAQLALFNQGAQSLFAPEDITRQGIVGEDRHGNTQFFPLTTVAIGAVRVLPPFPGRPETLMATLAARAKRHAKRAQVGFYLLSGDVPWLNQADVASV
jgi:hypothetical protein